MAIAHIPLVSGGLPPILEVEDRPVINFTRVQTPPPENPSALPLVSPGVKYHDNRIGGSEGEGSKEQLELVKLGPDRPSRTIDDHAQFWSTYDKVTDTFDKELLDAWNKSLDVLLIFAGLFSAINTAFIIESYSGLQPDPAEITNDLLRLFITHRSDNITLSFEDLNPGSPAQSTILINSIFFSSLSFSLTAAFGAVTAKQWLTEYANVGGMKALHTQGRRRQEKYNGLKTWHLRLIIELLPMLLQTSLLLFLVGVVQLLWTLDRTVAIGQFVLSSAGLAIYVATIIIGIVVPTSPFQTPLSRYLPRFFDKTRRAFNTLASTLKSLVPNPRIEVEWISAAIAKIAKVQVQVADAATSLRSQIGPHLSGFIQRIRIVSSENNSTTEEMLFDVTQWDKTDFIAAEAVVGILEQAEHPDVTIIALDAVPRLPPDLLLSMVQQREGLLERLIQFHNGLLPSRSPSNGGLEWIKSWPNKAIVSGTALHHLLKPHRPGHGNAIDTSSIQTLDRSYCRWDNERDEDPVAVTKYLINLNLNLNLNLSRQSEYSYEAMYLRNFLDCMSSLLSHSPLLEVELMDARQGLIGGHFMTPVFPLQLLLDLIIRYMGDQQMYYYCSDLLRSFSFHICTELQGGLPRDVVSHVALSVAAMGWKLKGDNRLDSSLADGTQFGHSLFAGYLVADKSAMLLENIALALSMVDICDHEMRFCLDPRIFQILFEIAYPLLGQIPRTSDQKIPYPGFGRSLLHLSRVLPPGHKETRLNIVRCLSSCPVSDWTVPMAENVGDGFAQLLRFLLPRDTYWILNTMAKSLDDTQFLTIIKSKTWIYPCYKSISCMEFIRMGIANRTPTFHLKVLSLQDHDTSTPSVLLEMQIFFAAELLAGGRADDALGFLNQMVAEDSELFWPPYFITAGIVPPTHAEPPIIPKYIDRSHLSWQTERGWQGEALLMLWRKGRGEHAKGGLPPNWDDYFFFDAPVFKMTEYLEHVRLQNYTGVDWNLIKEYFRKALDIMQDKSHHDGGHAYSLWEKKFAQIVQDLCDYSNDHPPPPLATNPSYNAEFISESDPPLMDDLDL